MLLPFGTAPGEAFGPVNVVIGFFAAVTSAFAFARVSLTAVTCLLAPAGAIAVIATTAETTASAVSATSFFPRPAFGCFMRPSSSGGSKRSPRGLRTLHVRTYSHCRQPSTSLGWAGNRSKPVVSLPPYQPRYGQRGRVPVREKEASWTSPI